MAILIAVVAATASAALAYTLPGTMRAVAADPRAAATFLVLTLALQLFSVEVYGRGSLGVSAIGLLAAGFALGPGPAMTIALVAAVVQWVRRRGVLHKAIFDAADFTLAAATAAAADMAVRLLGGGVVIRCAAAVVAGIAFAVVNAGLLSLAMSLSESVPVHRVWRERFHWARFHFLSFGPLAFASTLAYDRIGIVGPLAFALPPALLVFSMRQYVERTRVAVEEVRGANEELSIAVTELAARNDDLHHLFTFAGGLAARTHDRGALVAYAREWLALVTGCAVEIRLGADAPGIPLQAGGTRVGGVILSTAATFQAERWERLAETVLPQLATAVESAELVEEVRRRHLATIAALSRSMEAKDYYTGGHTERVAELSLTLARRLGYAGADELESIEIGALLHDIGKIGIPERILHKPGPLDEEERRVMREHPVISESILREADLPELVLEIARHHHERLDGLGYPDGLSGDAIPLAARIVHVADAFDALTTDRPYRRACTANAAIDTVRAAVGSEFCPLVVGALERLHCDEPDLLRSQARALRVA